MVDFDPERDAEYIGGRKLCPLCEIHIDERQQTCRQCAVPGEQCSCGAQLPMGPYGHPCSCCNDCGGDYEPNYDAPTAREQYEAAWEQRRSLRGY